MCRSPSVTTSVHAERIFVAKNGVSDARNSASHASWRDANEVRHGNGPNGNVSEPKEAQTTLDK